MGCTDYQMAGTSIYVGLKLLPHVIWGTNDCNLVQHCAEILGVRAPQRVDGRSTGDARVVVHTDDEVGDPLEGAEIASRLPGDCRNGLNRFPVPTSRIEIGHPPVAQEGGPSHGGLRPTAHYNRRSSTLGWWGVNSHIGKMKMASGMSHGFRCPESAQERDGLVGSRSPLVHGHAAGSEVALLLAPHAYADNKPPLRCSIQICQLLGNQSGRVEGQEQDSRAEAHSARLFDQTCQGHQYFRRRVGRGDMASDPECSGSGAFETVHEAPIGFARYLDAKCDPVVPTFFDIVDEHLDPVTSRECLLGERCSPAIV
jgi:hypothetical protein